MKMNDGIQTQGGKNMYCTKCGRKLEDGEVCTCTQKTQVPHMQASGEQEQQEKNVFKNVHLNEKDTEWAREKGT